MAAFTIQELIDRAASQADMEDSFVSPQEWLQWYINEARSLDLFTLRSGYTQARPSIEPADGDYELSLADTKAVLGVYEVRNSKYRPLRYKTPAEFYVMDIESASRPTGDAQYFTVERVAGGATVVLSPKPTSGTYVALHYEDVGAGITAITDSVGWPLGFEERIVLGMAIRALTKEESDTRGVEKLYKEETDRIEELCFGMAFGSGARIRNTDARERGWGSWYDTMPYGAWDTWTWI